MAINNVDQATLTLIFSLAKDPKNGECGVQVQEHYAHVYKKGIDLKVGPFHWDINKKSNDVGTSMMSFNEVELNEKIINLRQSPVVEAAPYEKAFAALQTFKSASAGEGGEILRQTNTFETEGNILTGRTAVLRTVETGASGAETTLVRAFKARDLARYVFQLYSDNNRINHVGFYMQALEKIGGRVDGKPLSELMKPFKFQQR